MHRIILKWAGILWAIFIFFGWLLFYSPLSFPTNIPRSPINISGLSILIAITGMSVLEFRDLIRLFPSLSVLKLASAATASAFAAEFLFQALRQIAFETDSMGTRIYNFGQGVLVLSAMSFALSLIVAYQMKTRKLTYYLYILLIIILAGCLITALGE